MSAPKTVSIIPTNDAYSQVLTWSSSPSLTYSDLMEISDTSVDEMMKSIGPLWTMDDIDFSMIERFVYDGFDYKSLLKVIRKKMETGKWTVDQLKDNLSKALAIHQLTGNMTAKRYNSLGGPGKQMVNEVNAAFGIKMGKKSGLTRFDITYPRLGALFPFPLSAVANKFPKDFASKYSTTQLPSFMKTSSFPSLIPTSQPYTDVLMIAYTCYSIDMTVALSGKSYHSIKPEELAEIINRQENFARLSLNSGVVEHSVRIKAMRALRVDSQSTYDKLLLVNTAFGIKNLPAYPDWKSHFDASYASVISDTTKVPLQALAGNPFEVYVPAPVESPPARSATFT